MKITKKNYKQVCRKLEKFFSHKSFIEWHTYRGGLKKRISDNIAFEPNDIKRQKLKIIDAKTRDNGAIVFFNYVLGESKLTGIHRISIGDEILFCGNRVIIKEAQKYYKSYGISHLYCCYQIDK